MRCALITGLLLLCSIILLAQTPHYWQQDAIWDNEKLLVFDHLQLMHRGVALWDINLARIPSIAPDYFIAEITRGLSQDIRIQYLLFLVALSSVQLGLGAAIVSKLTNARLEIALINLALISYLLGWISPDFVSNRSLAALPLNHGGNLAMVLLFYLALISFASRQEKISRLKVAALGLIALAAVASNRIFLIQALGPAVALLSFQRQPWLLSKQKHCALAALITGGSGGLLLSRLILKTGCTPPLTWDATQMLTHLNNLFQTDTSNVGIGFLIASNLALSLFIFCKESSEPPARLYAGLILSGSAMCLLVYPFIYSNQGIGAGNLRYLLPQISTTSIAVAYLLTVSLYKKHRMPMASLLALCFAALISSQAPKIPDFANIFSGWTNPYTNFVADNVPLGIGILTAQEGNYLASSRSLKAGSNWRFIASQIASDGNPNPWDQGKAEFYSDARSKHLRKYRAVLLQASEHKQVLEWYGPPSTIASDKALAAEIFLYDDVRGSNIDKKLTQGIAGDFRIACN
jgi:hypothetical protein